MIAMFQLMYAEKELAQMRRADLLAVPGKETAGKKQPRDGTPPRSKSATRGGGSTGVKRAANGNIGTPSKTGATARTGGSTPSSGRATQRNGVTPRGGTGVITPKAGRPKAERRSVTPRAGSTPKAGQRVPLSGGPATGRTPPRTTRG